MASNELAKAIQNLDVAVVERILTTRNISINKRSQDDHPPIIECVTAPNTVQYNNVNDAKRCEILKLLVRHGANLNIRSLRNEWPSGLTAVLMAARCGLLKCLRFLVESGADLNITSSEGDTALMYAALRGKDTCVKYLLEKTPPVALEYRNDGGETALIMAALGLETGSFLCLQHIVEAGADLSVKDSNGDTALMHALSAKSREAVVLLLKKGASVNTVNSKGLSPLNLDNRAENNIDLLNCGLDPTLTRMNRYCLHASLEKRRSKPMVRALVMHGFPPPRYCCVRYL